MNSPAEIGRVPLQGKNGDELLVRDVAQVCEGTMPGEYGRYNMRRLVTITANIEGEDLGRVIRRLNRALQMAGEPPRGVQVDVRGQVVPMMDQMVRGLNVGLALAMVVIYPAADGVFPIAAAGVDLGLGDPGSDCRGGRLLGADRNHSEHSIVHGPGAR
jgi:multidrug efflux pump subunit AcrB